MLAHHLAQRVDIGTAPEWLRPILHFALRGDAGVAAFFVLSGFLLSRPFWMALDAGEAMPSLRDYALRRAARILPGCWLALSASLLVSVTLFQFPLTAELFWRFLAGFLLVSDWHWRTFFPVEVNGPLWSIGFEASCYALLPLAFAAMFGFGHVPGPWRRRMLWPLAVGAALLAHWAFVSVVETEEAGRGFQHGFQGGAKLWVPAWNPFGFFAVFAVGAAAAGAETLVGRSASPAALFKAIAVTIFAVLAPFLLVSEASNGFGGLAIPYGFPWLPLAVALLLLVLPSLEAAWPITEHEIVRFVATISFGLYVWHMLVIDTLRRLAAPWVATTQFGPWLVIDGAGVALTFGIAVLSWRHLERPVIGWAARQSRGTRRALA